MVIHAHIVDKMNRLVLDAADVNWKSSSLDSEAKDITRKMRDHRWWQRKYLITIPVSIPFPVSGWVPIRPSNCDHVCSFFLVDCYSN
jgi:hypothetical protein